MWCLLEFPASSIPDNRNSVNRMNKPWAWSWKSWLPVMPVPSTKIPVWTWGSTNACKCLPMPKPYPISVLTHKTVSSPYLSASVQTIVAIIMNTKFHSHSLPTESIMEALLPVALPSGLSQIIWISTSVCWPMQKKHAIAWRIFQIVV